MLNKTFTSWSFSRYQDYMRCPAYAKYKHLLRLPTESGPAAERGTTIHKGAEKFVLDVKAKLLPELRLFKQELYELRVKRKVVQLEAMWGFDRSWQPCEWNDWNRCWLRVKMDASYLVPAQQALHMIDWKSGKPKPEEHQLQLELYGVTGLRKHPSIKLARGYLHYTDLGPKSSVVHTVKRAQETKLIKFWEKEVKPMFNDQRFAPRPGRYCSWCDFSKAKGGPCTF